MNFSHYIAQRLYHSPRSEDSGYSISPIIRLSIIGVALSVAVMLLSVTITVGFKRTVLDYAANITGDIGISRFGSSPNGTGEPISITPRLEELIRNTPGVSHANRQARTMGLIKTDSTFEGTAVVGIDSSYNRDFYRSLLVQGVLPSFSSTDSTPNAALMPENICAKLDLKIGDRVRIYFTDQDVRVRAFTLVGIYKSVGVSVPVVFCEIGSVQRLLGWGANDISNLNVYCHNHNMVDDVAAALVSRLEASSLLPQDCSLGVATAREMNPTIFSWLDILNTNVYILLALLSIVSGFTMIAGLIILVLDKTRLIGTLKAMGATEATCRNIFIRLSMMLALRGLFGGNVIAVVLALIQKYGQVIRLNRASYYMDYVPMSFSLTAWIAVNAAAVLLILLMLIGPAHIVGRISPARTMRFD